MVFAQTQEETVLAGVASQKGINQMILSKETDQERMSLASYISNMASGIMTATVSYGGRFTARLSSYFSSRNRLKIALMFAKCWKIQQRR